jgi:hypothetical protein
MEIEKMFETAIRTKMRFPYKGMISVEDLWDLPLRELDSVFKTLNKQVKQSQEESLLSVKSKEDETLETQISIVRYIVSVKIFEAETAKQAKEQREKKQKIMELIAAKKEEALGNKSIEELEAMLAQFN